MVRIYPSLIAANQQHLEEEVELLEQHCTGFHLDVMDNKFVPNVALSVDTVNAIAQRSKPIWLHLMVEKPEDFYVQFSLPHDSLISFHIESEVDVVRFAKIIKEKKHKPSIAISPKTPLERIVPFLNIVDQVLLMSVNPGFSGQSFLKNSFDRLAHVVQLRQEYHAHFRIGIDGGIDTTNVKKIVEMGAQDLAIGSAIFKQKNSLVTLQYLTKEIQKK